MQNVPGLSPDTRRKLNLLRNGLTLAAPTDAGRRRRAQPHRDRSLLAIWPRPRDDERRDADRQRDRGADGHGPRSRPSCARCGRAGTTMSARRCAAEYQRMVEIANAGARELGFADTGAMWRSKYDMSPDEFAALTERLWNQVGRSTSGAALLRPRRPQPPLRRRRPARHRPDPRRSARQSVGAGMGQYLRRRRAAQFGPARLRSHPSARAAALYARADRPHRRGLLHLARLRAAAGDLLEALDDHPAARPRGDLPRLGLGRRQPRRSARQDVHPGQRRRFRHRPSRARPQFLPARLYAPALPLRGQRQ